VSVFQDFETLIATHIRNLFWHLTQQINELSVCWLSTVPVCFHVQVIFIDVSV